MSACTRRAMLLGLAATAVPQPARGFAVERGFDTAEIARVFEVPPQFIGIDMAMHGDRTVLTIFPASSGAAVEFLDIGAA